MRDDSRVRAGRALRLALLIALALLFLIPFYLLVRNGLAAESDITSPSGPSSRPRCTGGT